MLPLWILLWGREGRRRGGEGLMACLKSRWKVYVSRRIGRRGGGGGGVGRGLWLASNLDERCMCPTELVRLCKSSLKWKLVCEGECVRREPDRNSVKDRLCWRRTIFGAFKKSSYRKETRSTGDHIFFACRFESRMMHTLELFRQLPRRLRWPLGKLVGVSFSLQFSLSSCCTCRRRTWSLVYLKAPLQQ